MGTLKQAVASYIHYEPHASLKMQERVRKWCDRFLGIKIPYSAYQKLLREYECNTSILEDEEILPIITNARPPQKSRNTPQPDVPKHKNPTQPTIDVQANIQSAPKQPSVLTVQPTINTIIQETSQSQQPTNRCTTCQSHIRSRTKDLSDPSAAPEQHSIYVSPETLLSIIRTTPVGTLWGPDVSLLVLDFAFNRPWDAIYDPEIHSSVFFRLDSLLYRRFPDRFERDQEKLYESLALEAVDVGLSSLPIAREYVVGVYAGAVSDDGQMKGKLVCVSHSTFEVNYNKEFRFASWLSRPLSLSGAKRSSHEYFIGVRPLSFGGKNPARIDERHSDDGCEFPREQFWVSEDDSLDTVAVLPSYGLTLDVNFVFARGGITF